MGSTARQPVITGCGLISPLGNDPKTLLAAMLAGKSGVRRIQNFDAGGLPVQFGGEVDGFDAKQFIDKKERKRLAIMPRAMQLGMAAAQLAMQDAGLEGGQVNPDRFAVVFGTGTIPGKQDDLGAASRICRVAPGGVDLKKWGAEGMALVPPMWMLNFVPNMLACHVSILHDARGPVNSVTQTEVGGLLALDEACRMIRRGRADVALVGAGDSRINAISGIRQCLFSSLSQRHDDPESACRPFDRGRDGSVLGEGGGVLVIEERAHARSRKARILAEVAGHGAALDADGTGDGVARTVALALAGAGISPAAVDHINAHGISTRAGDACEARGLAKVFGAQEIPVVAVKSYMGNLGSAGGIVELIASLAAQQEGTVPPTRNYREPDPECPVAVLRDPRSVVESTVLKVSMTELGQCAAVVIRRLAA
jgi:3-oxoacyl-[acyl-carrier-protein] synthase II